MIKKLIGRSLFEKVKQKKQDILDYQKGKTLYYILRWAVTIGVYERNSLGRNATYCNVWSYELLDSRCKKVWNVKTIKGEDFVMGGEINAFDYDITSIMRDNSIDNLLQTPIGVAYKNGLEAVRRGIIKEHTPDSAQDCANRGIPIMVISRKYDHVAIVAPTFKEYDKRKGVYLGNVGGYNDMMYISDGRTFGHYDWEDEEIKYWEFPVFKGV